MLGLALVACSLGGYASYSGPGGGSSEAESGEAALPARASQAAPTRRPMGPLRRLRRNPRYFTADGVTAVYLTGSHNWHNLVDASPAAGPAPFDYTRYLNDLKRWNHNFIRLWAWDMTQGKNYLRSLHFYAPHPYVRSGPGTALDGKPKFDLRRLNQAYFDRLRRRVVQARKAGIYVSIMLFEGYMADKGTLPDAYRAYPFVAENNVNGVDGDVDGDGRANEVYRLPAEGGLRTVTEIQKTYVRKVVDTVNDLDNVLYEIANEAPKATTSWQYELIDYIKAYESKKPRQHPVGMTFQWRDGDNATLLASNADWISPRDPLGDLPPASGAKVILSDSDHHCGICTGANRDWAWRELMRGRNPILMDGYGNAEVSALTNATDAEARKGMGDTRRYANRINLAGMSPRGDLTSTGHALAQVGKEYLVYQPRSGAFTLNLAGQAGRSFAVEWFHVASGSTGRTTVSGGTAVTLTPPAGGPVVAHVRASPSAGRAGG